MGDKTILLFLMSMLCSKVLVAPDIFYDFQMPRKEFKCQNGCASGTLNAVREKKVKNCAC